MEIFVPTTRRREVTVSKPKKYALDPNTRFHYDVWQVVTDPDGNEEAFHIAPARTEILGGNIADAFSAMDHIIAESAGVNRLPNRYIVRARERAEHTIYRTSHKDVKDFIKSCEEHAQEMSALHDYSEAMIADFAAEAEQGYDLDLAAIEINPLDGRCDDPGCPCQSVKAADARDTVQKLAEELVSNDPRYTPQAIAKREARAAKAAKKKAKEKK